MNDSGTPEHDHMEMATKDKDLARVSEETAASPFKKTKEGASTESPPQEKTMVAPPPPPSPTKALNFSELGAKQEEAKKLVVLGEQRAKPILDKITQAPRDVVVNVLKRMLTETLLILEEEAKKKPDQPNHRLLNVVQEVERHLRVGVDSPSPPPPARANIEVSHILRREEELPSAPQANNTRTTPEEVFQPSKATKKRQRQMTQTGSKTLQTSQQVSEMVSSQAKTNGQLFFDGENQVSIKSNASGKIQVAIERMDNSKKFPKWAVGQAAPKGSQNQTRQVELRSAGSYTHEEGYSVYLFEACIDGGEKLHLFSRVAILAALSANYSMAQVKAQLRRTGRAPRPATPGILRPPTPFRSTDSPPPTTPAWRVAPRTSPESQDLKKEILATLDTRLEQMMQLILTLTSVQTASPESALPCVGEALGASQ
jgi:hypothetical protein